MNIKHPRRGCHGTPCRKLALCRISSGAQVTAELNADLDQGRLALLAREFMLKRRVHGFGEAGFLDRCDLAGECIRLWIFDVKSHVRV
jgi:hypothetical protein